MGIGTSNREKGKKDQITCRVSSFGGEYPAEKYKMFVGVPKRYLVNKLCQQNFKSFAIFATEIFQTEPVIYNNLDSSFSGPNITTFQSQVIHSS